MFDSAAASGFTAGDLDRLFRPRSIAVIGASNRKDSPGNRVVKIALKHGFPGKLYPVNPASEQIEGLKSYSAITDLPEVPDVALIVTAAAIVPEIIDQCGTFGVRAAIVFSAGFEEVDDGRELAEKLAAAARKHGIAVLGANGQGLWSVHARSILTFGIGAFLVEDMKHAPIAIISQSGALSGAIGGYLQRNAIGCSYIVSVGNETVLDCLDVLAWIVEQDDVRVVGLYIEGLKDAHRLVMLAAKARERGVQIVALKAGRSTFGQEATASHTGKIASPYSIYHDILDQAGVIVAESLSELISAVEILATLPDLRAGGTENAGVSILSSSGGAGALLADHADKFQMPLAQFSSSTVARLKEVLPAFARKDNPIDLTGQVGSSPNLFRDALSAVSADLRTEAIVVQFSSSGMRDLERDGEIFKQTARDTGVPVIITFAAETLTSEKRAEFRDAGIILSEDPFDTMRALSWIYKRRGFRTLPIPQPQIRHTNEVRPRSWSEWMDFLLKAGVTPAPWIILPPDRSAEECCAGLCYPLVVKALPSAAKHKTEMGLVRLRVTTADEVDAIAAEFRDRLGSPEIDVLVQEMIRDGQEVVLACLRKTDFGPVLSIGTGGTA